MIVDKQKTATFSTEAVAEACSFSRGFSLQQPLELLAATFGAPFSACFLFIYVALGEGPVAGAV